MAKDWDALDPDERIRLRDRLLKRQVRHQLYPYSLFYRELLDGAGIQTSGIAGADDLSELPVVRRTDLARRGDDFLLRPKGSAIQRWASARQLTQVFLEQLLRGVEGAERTLGHEYSPVMALHSSGTAGQPLRIWLTRRDLAVLGTAGARLLALAKVEAGEGLLNLLHPVSPGGYWQIFLGAVAAEVKHLAPGPLASEELSQVMADTDPEVVAVRAEEAFEVLDARGPSMRVVMLAPEVVPEALYQKLLQAAGPVKVMRTYHFVEGRVLWGECFEGAGQSDGGYHLYPDLEIVESLSSATGQRTDPGEAGEVAYTGLDQRGTALARYLPGDVTLGGVIGGRCPYCGRVLDRIVGPVVRQEHLLRFEMDGRSFAVDVERVHSAMAVPRLKSWEVEVRKAGNDPWGPDELYVRFEPAPRKDPTDLAIELHLSLVEELGVPATQLILADGLSGDVMDARPRSDSSPE